MFALPTDDRSGETLITIIPIEPARLLIMIYDPFIELFCFFLIILTQMLHVENIYLH